MGYDREVYLEGFNEFGGNYQYELEDLSDETLALMMNADIIKFKEHNYLIKFKSVEENGDVKFYVQQIRDSYIKDSY